MRQAQYHEQRERAQGTSQKGDAEGSEKAQGEFYEEKRTPPHECHTEVGSDPRSVLSGRHARRLGECCNESVTFSTSTRVAKSLAWWYGTKDRLALRRRAGDHDHPSRTWARGPDAGNGTARTTHPIHNDSLSLPSLNAQRALAGTRRAVRIRGGDEDLAMEVAQGLRDEPARHHQGRCPATPSG